MQRKNHFMRISGSVIVLCILVVVIVTVGVAQTMEEKYKRAEEFSWGKVQKLMFKTEVKPNWIGDSDRFWYYNKTREGKEFILIDPQKNIRNADHVFYESELLIYRGLLYNLH